MLRAPAFAALVVALLSCMGCEHFQRAAECRAIAKVVNPVLRSIDEARRKSPEDAKVHRAIAKDYDRLAISLIGMRPENRRVQEVVADYQRLMREASRDASQYADALGARDQTRVLAARTAASRTMKHEATAVAHFDATCRGK